MEGMDNYISSAEATAVIVVNAVRTHTSLCIPGATQVRPAAALSDASSTPSDVNAVQARITTD